MGLGALSIKAVEGNAVADGAAEERWSPSYAARLPRATRAGAVAVAGTVYEGHSLGSVQGVSSVVV